MKSLVAALVLLAVILGSSIINCFYIDRITTEMIDLEKSFPEKLTDGNTPESNTIDKAKELWKKSQPRLYMTVKATYINAITASLGSTVDYYESGTAADYNASRRILRDTLIALKEADSLSLKSII